ncbi:MAG: transaldolase [Candidatus Eremiobacteraeota bacterium]|nr:transaldolase [Candidatus Eremiobacteraeota bacterium]
MKSIKALKVKIFADGAKVEEMKEEYRKGIVKGFTTNPTLMRKAGVADYGAFAREVLREIRDLPVSFEVFSDEFASMEREARIIASWGGNVNVKIPITTTSGESSAPLIRKLSVEGISLNVTAILTMDQIRTAAESLAPEARSIVSVFAGRIADTGRDPVPMMKEAAEYLKGFPHIELLWASPRELLNIFHADECGCHIITVTADLLKKLSMVGMDLEELSLETVKMFYRDGQSLGYRIEA